jgi:hypothetical protein
MALPHTPAGDMAPAARCVVSLVDPGRPDEPRRLALPSQFDFKFVPHKVTQMAFSPDGRWLVAG